MEKGKEKQTLIILVPFEAPELWQKILKKWCVSNKYPPTKRFEAHKVT